MDLLLKNSTAAVWENNQNNLTKINIGIKDGKIAYLGRSEPAAQEVVDLAGLTTLPGVIDSQVHFREPGFTHKEDIESGSRGAALGGVTAFFEMPNTIPATTTEELHLAKRQSAEKTSWVNYAFFIGGSAENTSHISTLENLPSCPGVKVFMGSSTGTLLVEDDATLEKIIMATKRPVVIHSEDEARLRDRKHIALENKHAKFHHIWRDEESALKSTQRAVNLAKKHNRKLHILHLTTAQEMSFLATHKQWATLEVLPQHLTLSAPECYERLGNFAQQNPPIRGKEHQDALWRAINSGLIDVLGSDHAPHTREEKLKEYPQSPSGMPGVQTLLPIMLDHVNQGKLSLLRLIDLVCEGPRKVFSIKNKGRIEVGCDADLSIVDLKLNMTIENSWIQSRSGWTPFHGYKVTGWPIHTICNGKFVVRDKKLIEKSAKAVAFN